MLMDNSEMRLSVTKLAVLVVFIVFTSVVSSIASAQTGGGRPAPDNTTPGKITVQLSGTATANSDTDLRLEPAVLENGIVEVGKLKQQTIQIVHSGAEGSDPIQINDAVLTGSGANDYETSFSGFAILYPGDRIPVVTLGDVIER